jgi:hypothetical protein
MMDMMLFVCTHCIVLNKLLNYQHVIIMHIYTEDVSSFLFKLHSCDPISLIGVPESRTTTSENGRSLNFSSRYLNEELLMN